MVGPVELPFKIKSICYYTNQNCFNDKMYNLFWRMKIIAHDNYFYIKLDHQ